MVNLLFNPDAVSDDSDKCHLEFLFDITVKPADGACTSELKNPTGIPQMRRRDENQQFHQRVSADPPNPGTSQYVTRKNPEGPDFIKDIISAAIVCEEFNDGRGSGGGPDIILY